MKTKILAFALVLGIFMLSGCVQSEKGTLVMQMTDAPSALNIEKAFVTVSKIQVHLAVEDENATTESGWITVVEGPKTFDLVAIKDITGFLGETQLNVGKYTQIRLTVDNALVTIDGKESDLTIPSKTVKIVRPFDVVAGETLTLTLDFDAQESIKSTGKETYIMNPTIKILQEKPEMHLGEARRIGAAECAADGTLKETQVYNPNSKTWWIDLEATTPKEGCNPACVVDAVAKTAEVNWRCTGLAPAA